MSGSGDGQRPTPMMMPRRRPMIPPAQRPPVRSTYVVAQGIPRRGVLDAVIWPDTGVLLNLGTDEALLNRFRRHYQGRIRVTKTVARELRRHSEHSTVGLPDDDRNRVAAAGQAFHSLLVGPGRLNPVEAALADLPDIANVTQQLKARSESVDKRHGGEAEIIVLASKQATRQRRKNVLLTNDGDASVIAGQHGIPARHFGDILAEFACADRELSAAECLRVFTAAVRISAPPAHCRPSKADYFTCAKNEAGCALCDTMAEAQPVN
jgi:hypothetical protein